MLQPPESQAKPKVRRRQVNTAELLFGSQEPSSLTESFHSSIPRVSTGLK